MVVPYYQQFQKKGLLVVPYYKQFRTFISNFLKKGY